MTVHGGLKVTYTAHGRSNAHVRYNKDTKLANLTLSGDLEAVMSLRADELSRFLNDGAKALALMLEDSSSIGYDTLTETNTRSIDRLEHLVGRIGIRPQAGANE